MGLLNEDLPSDAEIRALVGGLTNAQPRLDLPDGWRSEKLEFDQTETFKHKKWRGRSKLIGHRTPDLDEPIEVAISLPAWLVSEYEEISRESGLELDQVIGDGLALLLGDSSHFLPRWLLRARKKMLTGRFTW
jgi:hypothetical protein